jgi:hypothetical protein
MESCSTMGEYSSSYFESPIMDVFPYFSEEEDLEKLKSLMHLKQLDLKLQQIEDTMEFAVEEETAS